MPRGLGRVPGREMLAIIREHGPISIADVAKRHGTFITNASRQIAMLRERGEVRIGAWRNEPSERRIMLLVAGSGKDAPPPPRPKGRAPDRLDKAMDRYQMRMKNKVPAVREECYVDRQAAFEKQRQEAIKKNATMLPFAW